MDNLNLIDSTFKRVCDFLKANYFTILLEDNMIYLYVFYTPYDMHNWLWRFNSKEGFLLSKNIKDFPGFGNVSVFEYISIKESYIRYVLKHKEIYTFINVCKILKDCSCLEELIIKMDLIGI